MSKRIKKKQAAKATAPTTQPGAPAEGPSPGAELLRRLLLALLTLLIVARPFVWGEDAGLLSEFAEPSGMALTLLTFLAGAGWAAWRLWSRQGGVHLGAVEISLLLLAGLYVVGANVAPYARPAWFTAADWLGLVVLLFLTRQLATRPDEQHGLMTVLLATAVALSAQGVYQASYQMPRLVKESGKEVRPSETAVDTLAAMRGVAPTPLERRQLIDQLDRRLVSGPFFRPSSLAACLVLLVPLLGGAVVACVRGKSPPLLTGAVGVCVLAAGVVLGMTRDAAAAAALALAALPWIGLQWPARLGGWPVGFVGGLALAAGVVFVLHRTGRLEGDLTRWREVWPAAYALGDSHFWTGVGPGQFRFFYPRFMRPDAAYKAPDPSSSLLEVFAEAGVGGVVLLLVAVALLARATARWWLAPPPPGAGSVSDGAGAGSASDGAGEDPSLTLPAPGGGELRWEFYLGGMLATILSFTLRANAVSPTEVTTEAVAAGIRSVCWFIAFALFERVGWTPREYVGSLVVGVAAVLLTFAVGPGLSDVAVASLLWAAVGLLLAVVRPEPAAWQVPAFVTRFLPGLGMRFGVGASLAALLAVAAAYFTFAVYPASEGTSAVREARYQRVRLEVDQKKPQGREIKNAESFVKREIIDRLEHASKEDASNASVWVLRSQYALVRWLSISPADAAGRKKAHDEAIEYATAARRANPEGLESYLVENEIHATVGADLARGAKAFQEKLDADAKFDPKKAGKDDKKQPPRRKLSPMERADHLKAVAVLHNKSVEAFTNAADALRPALIRDPYNPDLRYRLAHALHGATKKADAEDAAREALRIDDKVGKGRPRSLSDPQRERLNEILSGRSAP